MATCVPFSLCVGSISAAHSGPGFFGGGGGGGERAHFLQQRLVIEPSLCVSLVKTFKFATFGCAHGSLSWKLNW